MSVIDRAGQEEEIEEGGDSNALETKGDSEIGEAINDEAGKSDLDGGKEDRADGEGSEKKEGDLREDEEGGDEVKEPSLIEGLQAKIAELEEKMKPVQPPQEPPKAPYQPTEAEWEKYEEERGIPRTAQTWITQTMVRAVQDIQRSIDQRFARFDRQDAIASISKDPEFSDAGKYTKEVDQYLQKVDPRFHSDPTVLKDAVIYARGLNYKSGVQKVRDSREINKRISGVARPASSTGSSSVSKSAPKLTPLQKSAANAVNMSESEYSKLIGKGKVIAR